MFGLKLRCACYAAIAMGSIFWGRIGYGEDESWRPATAKELARIRFMAEGWIANYESFKSYRCKVRLRQGKCASVEKGRANGPDRDVVQATATMVVDGEKLCYVRKSDAKPKFDPASNTASVALPPVGFLFNGEQALDVDLFAYGGTLRSIRTWTDKGVDFTTWNEAGSFIHGEQGHFGPYLIKSLSLGNEFQLHAAAPVRGMIATRIDRRTPEGWGDSWLVDEERGFIPIERWCLPGGSLTQKAFVTDVQPCSGGRWFPTRCVVVYFNGKEENGDHTVREIVVSNLEVDVQPRPEEFQLPLPAGVSIYKEGIPHSGFTTANAKAFGLDDLPRVERNTSILAQERERAKVPPKNDSKLILLIAAAGAVLVVIGVIIALRRRST